MININMELRVNLSEYIGYQHNLLIDDLVRILTTNEPSKQFGINDKKRDMSAHVLHWPPSDQNPEPDRYSLYIPNQYHLNDSTKTRRISLTQDNNDIFLASMTPEYYQGFQTIKNGMDVLNIRDHMIKTVESLIKSGEDNYFVAWHLAPAIGHRMYNLYEKSAINSKHSTDRPHRTP